MKTAICIFCYNRLDKLKKTIESLKKTRSINDFPLFVFSDGPKSQLEVEEIEKIRNFIKWIDGFGKVQIYESKHNKGLAKSIIDGADIVFRSYESVIVLEDDLVVSKNFIEYMTQAIKFYKHDNSIFSISGFSPQIRLGDGYIKDFYFSPRGSSWGWATWKDRWETVDWKVSSYKSFKINIRQRQRFARGGSDLPRMLDHQMKGKIDSWAIRWVYQQFLNQQATVYPAISKVKSIGIGADATHTKKTKRFETILDDGRQQNFNFEPFQNYDKKILKEFRKTFSFWSRLSDRL